jgi:hypothetical protein
MNEFPETITIGDQTLTLSVERKAVKNINARLRGQALAVSIPLRAPREQVLPAINDLAQRLLRRVAGRSVNAEMDVLEVARRVAQRFPRPPEVSAVQFSTQQTSCWGSYSTRTRTIRLNAGLRHMPPWVLEAVMAHELAHALHPDHSPAFWQLLRAVEPQTDRAEAFLAGVTWLAHRWEELPVLEREQLGAAPTIDEGL